VSSSIEYISIMPYLTATPQGILLKIRCERWVFNSRYPLKSS